ncbi:outer membrane lipid asymmetry maintenance protein MlaD [Lysobacteraceae bacterium NML91-0213]|nr:outer membrane lipid asymmetry maintenance protein MlaD [Xanthomonadaceae bacterium NML91-0213]
MSSTRGPRLEFAVGAFLLLALASLLVLAIASTNNRFGFSTNTYELTARFSNIGQLRTQAPVRVGGVTIGRVAKIELDPLRFDSIATLAIDRRYQEMPVDTSASILTGGLLGEAYVDLQPGGDMESLQPGEEIAFTSPAVDLMQMVGRYMFSGPGGGDAADDATPPAPSEDTP